MATPMRFRFSAVLVAVTLALLLATIAVIGIVSYISGRDSAEDLANQVLAQTAERIEDQVQGELAVAIRQSVLGHTQMLNGRVDAHDREAVSGYFLDAIGAYPQLSYLSWSLEATGAHVTVERDRDGVLSAVYLVREPDNRLSYHRYAIGPGGARTEIESVPDKPENDPRPRPYYVAAKQANAPTWTETYRFFTNRGLRTVPGVTRATPVIGPDGVLVGVLSADFDMYALSEFLRGLTIGEHGMAFLVELRSDGTQQVIAHPDPAMVANADGTPLAAEHVRDPRVRAFLPAIDRAARPGTLMPVELDVDGTRFLGGYRRIDGDRGLHWVVAVAMPASDILGPVEHTRRTTIEITVVATIVAVLLVVLVAMQIGGALRRLTRETEAIGRFLLEAKPIVASNVVEVHQLSTAIEDMKRGLRSFQKFVPADLVRRLVQSGNEAVQGGKRETITMHFSDIADFTTISEQLAPEALVELLSEYLSLMSEPILESGGTIDKYIGDAVMAFWNAPSPVADHAFVACRTVLASARRLADRRAVWIASGKPGLRCRVGIHTGDAVVGNIGSEARLDFTAIGDTVNLANRLEGLNKNYGTELMISEATFALVKDRVVVRLLDRVAVKGKIRGIAIYELLGLAGEVDEARVAAAERHTRGLEAYFAQRWDEAIELLQGGEFAAQVIADRARAFKLAPPAADWDGVHRMTTK
jgi:adenylate cyclase